MTGDLSKTIYLTMDTDWAGDDVLSDSLTLIDELQVPVTIFITHETKLLETIRDHPLIRLGIHPNFYPLLQNHADQDYLSVIGEIKKIVPEAVSARSHGLIDSTAILEAFKTQGITRDLNLFIPFSSGIELKPFRHFCGLLRIPYFYEDDAYCSENSGKTACEHILSSGDGLKVFNFHPIHLFLNTENMNRYLDAKPFQREYSQLIKYVNRDRQIGARAFLKQVVECGRENRFTFDHVENL
ncbi:MAG TPA: hypothetical protein PK898_09535 [Flexilinea sp.]|nr:hypothetical protein [Flexilinea sp.]